MRAGRLNKLVAIQAATESKGATGQTVKTWATVKQVWAGIEPIKGEERIAAQGVQAKLTHRIILRYNSLTTLTSAHRFLLGSRVFEITAPPADAGERHRQWICDCREVGV